MPLDMPAQEANIEAEGYRRRIDAFDKSLGPETANVSFYSENPETMSLALQIIRPILPTVYALSECESYGRIEPNDLRLEAFTAMSYLYTDGNAALGDLEFNSLVRAARGIRLLAETVPSHDTIGSAIASIFSGQYASLLQRGAEAARATKELDLIVDEAARWKLRGFSEAARHGIAEELDRIDQDGAGLLPGLSPIERAQEMMWNTEPAKLKRKIFALRSGIQLFPIWSDDKKIWKMSSIRDASKVEFFWGFIKEREFELRRNLASMEATLIGCKAILSGGPWPTVEQLAERGVPTKDPVFEKAYIWKYFEGKKRLYGNVDPQDSSVDGFLLLSDDEHQRVP
jgi:hypothetical protein